MNRSISLIATILLAHNTFAAEFRTDRTWYLAGEQMTVSVTDQDALIAYAELCDTRGLAAGVAVGLSQGQGSGVIELPSSLHSGYYVLSVYTRDDAHVSSQLVAIVNPLHKSADDDIKWLPADSCWATGNGTADLVLHGAYIANDCVTTQLLGADQAADRYIVIDLHMFGSAEFCDNFRNI